MHHSDQAFTKTTEISNTENSELNEPLWAVVSFDQVEASHLNYDAATALMAELGQKGVSGLCIITVEAADRVS